MVSTLMRLFGLCRNRLKARLILDRLLPAADAAATEALAPPLGVRSRLGVVDVVDRALSDPADCEQKAVVKHTEAKAELLCKTKYSCG